MCKLKPEDLITKTILSDHQMICSRIHQDTLGFYVYHKPSDTEVQITHHKTVHENKAEAMVVLKDLLSPINLGDEQYGNTVYTVQYVYNKYITLKEAVLCERLIIDSLDTGSDICRTPDCARYLARENIKISLEELYKERDNLTKQLKELY